jgi:hypothetical protein
LHLAKVGSVTANELDPGTVCAFLLETTVLPRLSSNVARTTSSQLESNVQQPLKSNVASAATRKFPAV